MIFKYRAKNIFFLLVCISIFWIISARAQEEKQSSSGTKIIERGSSRMSVPKDTVVRQRGNISVVESVKENLKRRLLIAEERILSLEEKNKKLEDAVAQLKNTLHKLSMAQEQLKEKITYLTGVRREVETKK